MKFPFTPEAFFQVFAEYNFAVWPAQLVLTALALACFALTATVTLKTTRPLLLCLAFLWLWMGGVYHLGFFQKINAAATLFGAVFILQALLFLYWGWKRSAVLLSAGSLQKWKAIVIVAYALAGYPVLGFLLGHVFPKAPTFGVPCPTTIFTFGLLLLIKERFPWYVVIIPVLWSLIGFTAATSLSVPEDYSLFFAGIAFVMFYTRTQKEVPAS